MSKKKYYYDKHKIETRTRYICEVDYSPRKSKTKNINNLSGKYYEAWWVENKLINGKCEVNLSNPLTLTVEDLAHESYPKSVFQRVSSDVIESYEFKGIVSPFIMSYQYRTISTKPGETTYKAKGDYIKTIIANDGEYPNNGTKNGYWWVKKGLAPTFSPRVKYQGQIIKAKAYTKFNGKILEIKKAYTKHNGKIVKIK